MNMLSRLRKPGSWLVLAALVLTTLIYWPGLAGGWLFDDFPNIVNNPGVHPTHASLASLTRAALSSPSSEFKRPLASLTFALNYLASGLNPFGWKLVNLIIHLLNGVLVFVLARKLLQLAPSHLPLPLLTGGSREGVAASPLKNPVSRSGDEGPLVGEHSNTQAAATPGQPHPNPPLLATEGSARGAGEGARRGIVAALIATAWMLLPINLTAVLYVVQRMESMANVFVLLGLIGYVVGRQRMLGTGSPAHGMILTTLSLIVCTGVGVLAKETAVMLPLYAFLIEALIFRFHSADTATPTSAKRRLDRGVMILFTLVLVLPLVLGLVWLIPHVLNPETWATRDFTLRTRLLSEARIVSGYVAWTLLALPQWLSFYHDNFHVSTGLLQPWTTLAGMLFLLALVVLAWWMRRRRPLVSLGIALYLGCHLLTGTILPLELVYEHRNYFASFGLMLAIVPLLAVPRGKPLAFPRHVLLGGLLLLWTSLALMTSYAWGNPLRLARELSARAPDSPRAQYSLGRSYIVESGYKPESPFTPMVYAPLERAAKLPDASILPEQALIFFNARMQRPLKPAWWKSMIAKLKRRAPGVQDENSLAALTKCAIQNECKLPTKYMQQAFHAALSHPHPDARLLANYSDYLWNELDDHAKGLAYALRATLAKPDEPAYHITLARMYLVLDQPDKVREQIRQLERLNVGGRLDGSISTLRQHLSSLSNDTH